MRRGRPKAAERSGDKSSDITDEDRISELQAAHRLNELRQQAAMLGYDRFWNRYWLLAGPSPGSSCEASCCAFCISLLPPTPITTAPTHTHTQAAMLRRRLLLESVPAPGWSNARQSM